MSDKTRKLFSRIIQMKKRDTRPTELLRKPEAKHTEGWHMCIPQCFNDALDIRKTDRVTEGEKTLQWTQGSTFSFEAGNVLYDTPKAYERWSEAMKHVNLCIQIKEASGAVPGDRETDKKSGAPRNPGLVKFDILVPDKSRTKLVKDKEEIMTQDEFVRFLIFGPSTKTKDLFE